MRAEGVVFEPGAGVDGVGGDEEIGEGLLQTHEGVIAPDDSFGREVGGRERVEAVTVLGAVAERIAVGPALVFGFDTLRVKPALAGLRLRANIRGPRPARNPNQAQHSGQNLSYHRSPP